METIKTVSAIFGGKTFGRLFLATIWSAFAMWFVGYILTHPIAPDSLPFVNTFTGFIMGTIVAGILGYYFGSSQSSSDKDDMLKKQMPPQPTSSVTLSETDKTATNGS